MRSALLSCVIVVAATSSAGAWGLPAVLNNTPLRSSASTYADPDVFLAKARNAERLIDRSADSLFRAVASKEEQAKMEELHKKLNETTDDTEKNAIRHQITESEMATIEKRAKEREVLEEAKKWDERKKRQVSRAFYNFSLGALQAALLVPEGNSIANSIANNPVNAVRLALKLNSVYESIKSISGILSGTATVISAIKPLMSEADIEVKSPATATSAPVDAKDEL